jgi:hypothetical protein
MSRIPYRPTTFEDGSFGPAALDQLNSYKCMAEHLVRLSLHSDCELHPAMLVGILLA